MEISLGYQPKPKQAVFSSRPEMFKLFGGAMGGGKSYGLAGEGTLLSLQYPGNVGYVGREDFTDLERTTYRAFLDVIPKELIAQHNQSKHWIKFIPLPGPDGVYRQSEIYFGELKDIDSLKSLNLGWFAIDEASEVAKEAYLMLSSRLRLPIPQIRYFGLISSNPEPGWVKDEFITDSVQVEPDIFTKDGSRVFVRSLMKDNDSLPPNYEARLREQYPEQWVKRYIEGNWDAAEGQIFKEYDRNVHVVKPFDIPKEWERLFALDHGSVNPTAVIWAAIDWDGVMYIYDEHYQAGQLVSYHAQKILERGPLSQYSYTLVDPSTRAKNREKEGILWSVLDEYADHEISLVPADNDVLSSLNRINEAFKAGKLYIFENCVNLIRELPEYRWEKIKPFQVGQKDDPERPVKVNDHAIDALRYIINARPPSPTLAEPRPRGVVWIKKGPVTLAKEQSGSNFSLTQGNKPDL